MLSTMSLLLLAINVASRLCSTLRSSVQGIGMLQVQTMSTLQLCNVLEVAGTRYALRSVMGTGRETRGSLNIVSTGLCNAHWLGPLSVA